LEVFAIRTPRRDYERAGLWAGTLLETGVLSPGIGQRAIPSLAERQKTGKGFAAGTECSEENGVSSSKQPPPPRPLPPGRPPGSVRAGYSAAAALGLPAGGAVRAGAGLGGGRRRPRQREAAGGGRRRRRRRRELS
jgi:hypothetical protein